jgi:hypothetical protein
MIFWTILDVWWLPLCEYNLVLKFRGGAPQKRARVSLADLQAKDDDSNLVKDCFAVQFNGVAFAQGLKTTNRDKLVEYKARIADKSNDQIVAITVEYIDEYTALKDWEPTHNKQNPQTHNIDLNVPKASNPWYWWVSKIPKPMILVGIVIFIDFTMCFTTKSQTHDIGGFHQKYPNPRYW